VNTTVSLTLQTTQEDRTQNSVSHELRMKMMYDGTERKAVAPRCSQVRHFDSSVSICYFLTPFQ